MTENAYVDTSVSHFQEPRTIAGRGNRDEKVWLTHPRLIHVRIIKQQLGLPNGETNTLFFVATDKSVFC